VKIKRRIHHEEKSDLDQEKKGHLTSEGNKLVVLEGGGKESSPQFSKGNSKTAGRNSRGG